MVISGPPSDAFTGMAGLPFGVDETSAGLSAFLPGASGACSRTAAQLQRPVGFFSRTADAVDGTGNLASGPSGTNYRTADTFSGTGEPFHRTQTLSPWAQKTILPHQRTFCPVPEKHSATRQKHSTAPKKDSTAPENVSLAPEKHSTARLEHFSVPFGAVLASRRFSAARQQPSRRPIFPRAAP